LARRIGKQGRELKHVCEVMLSMIRCDSAMSSFRTRAHDEANGASRYFAGLSRS
jgi:hypothetical protein